MGLVSYGQVLENKDAAHEKQKEAQGTPPDPNELPGAPDMGMKKWWRDENMASIDGLPAMHVAPLSTRHLDNRMPGEEGGFKRKLSKEESPNGDDFGFDAPSKGGKDVKWVLDRFGDLKEVLPKDDASKVLSGLVLGLVLSHLL